MHQGIADRKVNRLWRVAIISPLILAVAIIASGSYNRSQADASVLPISSHSRSLVRTAVSDSSNPTVLSMAKSSPIRIRIPAIGVNSRLMKLGLQKDGSLQVPPSAFPAGWYTGSPTPGEIGPAIIAGHIDWNGPGVFYALNRVRLGDRIIVNRADGTTATFTVTRIAAFLKNAFPTEAVYGNLTYPGLRLITCGDYDFKLHKYVRDVVVFANLI